MEIADLKYFLTVAELENVNRAASKLLVAPSTLSKSIARLEAELDVQLFERIGKSIQLTNEGRFLQQKAFLIVGQEEAARIALSGGKKSFQVRICGEEILLETYGLKVMEDLLKLFPGCQFQLIDCDALEAQRKVQFGEAHLALTTQIPNKDLTSKVVDHIVFKTYVGDAHPLSKKAKAVSINDVLKKAFVVPENAVFGNIKYGNDGWNDEKFPRVIGFKSSGLSSLVSIVRRGLAIGYLPSYLGDASGLTALTIPDCHFECKQKVYLLALNPKETGWLNQIW